MDAGDTRSSRQLFEFLQRRMSASLSRVKKTPLEILAEALLTYDEAGEAAARILGAYDEFLTMIDDEATRKQLDRLSSQDAGARRVFQKVREISSVWPIIVHPDAITDFDLWAGFGGQLCVENMDLRKSTGRTAEELESAFSRLPLASFCCDVGHARQVDPTMAEATRILRRFGDGLRQLHVSEVNSNGTHDAVSFGCVNAFVKIRHLVPDGIPIVLESPVPADDVDREIDYVRSAIPLQHEELTLRIG